MTSLILLTLLRDDKATAAFDRYVKATKALPSYEVKITAKALKQPEVHADLIYDNGKRLRYEAKSPNDQYRLAISPLGYWEVDYASRTYDPYPYPGGVRIYSSRISALRNTIPMTEGVPDLRKLFPSNAKVVYVNSESVNGTPCDLVRVNYESREGKGQIDIYIAASGLLSRLFLMIDSKMTGHSEITWDLTDYKRLTSIKASQFASEIPDGFMPYSVDDHTVPVEVGAKPNLVGWVDSKSGAAWLPPAGKPVLFVLTGQDSVPSARALSAIRAWEPGLNQQGVQVVVGSDATTPSASKGLLYDPDQKSLKALNAPATPMFFLLDSGGAVRNLWIGVPPDGQDKLRADLLKAVAALK